MRRIGLNETVSMCDLETTVDSVLDGCLSNIMRFNLQVLQYNLIALSESSLKTMKRGFK